MDGRSGLLSAACIAVVVAACGGDEAEPRAERSALPPTARPETLAELLADKEAPRHPSDGGGRAEWREPPPEVRAGEAGRFAFVYTAGDDGIAVGGALLFLAPPFWDWSAPQARDPRAPGYVTVECSAPEVMLDARQANGALFAITVGGRDLAPGERVFVTYGAGERLARVDRYAERKTPFWFRVDGDGDGISELVPEPPTIDVLPGPAAELVVHLQSTAPTGGSARLDLALLDRFGNHALGPARVALRTDEGGPQVPAMVDIDARGTAQLVLEDLAPGTWRVLASATLAERELLVRSNPLWVEDEVVPVRWADLHGHSGVSDGTGTPDDYFLYARTVAALDIAALTDHDHFGVRMLDESPTLWTENAEAVARHHEPGRFVALHAYEWTNWIHGHRHVVHFAPDGPLFSSLDEATDTPAELWDALRGHPALTFAHHSAGSAIATNWDYAPDPVLEPLTEVMSVHGSSEAADSPQRIVAAVAGNFVRDQLARGYHLGFVGSGDGHDGHPGLSHRDPKNGFRRSPRGSLRVGRGGLAAVRCESLTRDGVLAALRERKVFATSGPRILLSTRLGDTRDASRVEAAALHADSRFILDVSGTGPIERIVFVIGTAGDDGIEVAVDPLDVRHQGEALDLRVDTLVGELPAGSFVYARIEQADGALAWSSPVFVD